MPGPALWRLEGVSASWCASPIEGDLLIGQGAEVLVTPASVVKVQIALTVLEAIDHGRLDGTARVTLQPASRTPGPVGISLMADAVEMSIRDLLIPMITVSDNVAADALLNAVGIEAVNHTTDRLGLADTHVVSDLQTMLDRLAIELGFTDYADLASHDPAQGPPTEADLRARIATSSALDPREGSRTTPADMVRLLSLIWTDAAGSAGSCSRLRSLMRQQLARHRIASGFNSSHTVAAKSGGLLGVVRNEIGVVTDPAGRSFAVAIFTRRHHDRPVDPVRVDAAIGALARQLVGELQAQA
jgi:beta-lactamase class A